MLRAVEHGIHGIIPPVTTPFDENGNLDEGALAGQCRWLLDRGVHAVTIAGSTGEGHTLSGEEVRRAAAAAMEAADGRAPVIAGVIANSTRDAVRRAAALGDLGVAALQVTPVHYLFRPDDDAMLGFFRAATEQSGLPVIIYNVVPWSYLAPDLLCRILREVPGVLGVKQSAGDMKLLADLLREAPAESLIPERGRRHAVPVVRARRARRRSGDSQRGAGSVRCALGRGRARRPSPRPRPARPAPVAVERPRRRQSAGVREVRPEPAGLPHGPSASADAGGGRRSAAGDRRRPGSARQHRVTRDAWSDGRPELTGSSPALINPAPIASN